MNKDEFEEYQNEQYQDAVDNSIALDAAKLVQKGYSRPAALAKASEINAYQREAEEDPTGTIQTLAEAQSTPQPEGKQNQTHAIAAELYREMKK